MNRYTGFSDLCIPLTNTSSLKATIREAIELGYRNVAIEQKYDATKPEETKKKDDPVPPPYCLSDLKADFGGQIRLLNRLTVVFADSSVSLVLNKSNNVLGYNLIAALPMNVDSLQYACQTMACDIITYNTGTITLKTTRKVYYLAVGRNIAFEIKYANMISNTEQRKGTIFRAHRYHTFGKSKNVIISSEANKAFQLRSPYDIANLGLIFGLSEEQSKEAIRDVPNRILLSAAGRRFGKAGVVIAHRGRKKNAVDSDDYSDTELEANIRDEDDDEVDDVIDNKDGEMGHKSSVTEEVADDLEEMQPPKKMAKHENNQ